MPGPIGILVPWLLSFTVCVLLAGRRLSVLRLSLSVLVSQALFHTLFVLGMITPSGVQLGHVHDAPLMLPTGTDVTPVLTADGTMWVGHLVAAALTVLALHQGERLLLALRDLAVQAVRWVQRRLDIVSTPHLERAVPLAIGSASDRTPAAAQLRALRGRGPPLRLSV